MFIERNFDIGKLLEFKLDFKTSELNGVLLSVTESSGSPSFSLELQNGNVSKNFFLQINNRFKI